MPHPLALLLSTTLLACAARATPLPPSPARASAEASAVIDAMFQLQPNQEGFYPPRDNAALQAVLAHHPALDPFETAALGDPRDLARQLAADPALITRVHPIGWTCLHFAAFGGNAGAVALLLDRGAALEQRAANKFANTALHVALLTGDAATVALLVARGADVAARYDGGTTALQLAAGLGRSDLIDVLLDRGAAIDARSDRGDTALAIAERGHHADAAAHLRARGAR